MPITVYHSNYRKTNLFQSFLQWSSTERPDTSMCLYLIRTRYKHIEIIYKGIDTYSMWSGYDFSNSGIPVYFFYKCGCEGSPKNSLMSANRKLLWGRHRSEEEVRKQRWLGESPTGKLWRTENSWTPEQNLQETKTRWFVFKRVLSGRFWSVSGAEGCAVAPDVRATSPTDDHRRPWTARRDNLRGGHVTGNPPNRPHRRRDERTTLAEQS